MKIGVDIDGVILDYERVLKTYGDLYDFIELKKNGIINRNEHYLRNRYGWTEEERRWNDRRNERCCNGKV